jgi:serine/threonine protein kinase
MATSDYESEISSRRRRIVSISGRLFNIDRRYKPKKKLGAGAYGVVASAIDRETGDKVAIKKVESVFDNLTDAKRILREVKLMRHFNHDNILSISDMIEPAYGEQLDDIYIVTEYMQSDLHRIVYSDNRLSDNHIAYIMFQIFRGLAEMHRANVIHRDLKPSNILINEDCSLKICDLGLSRGVDETSAEEAALTEYVVTRWYRAPEVICAAMQYGFGIDIWAAGCILAELYNREPLFQGTNYVDQLNCIFDVIGTPGDSDIDSIRNPKAKKYVKKLRPREALDWSSVVPDAPEEAIDLLNSLLAFNPANRPTAEEALSHPFFAKWANKYKSELDNDLEREVEHFDFGFENSIDTRSDLRAHFGSEILIYRPWCTEFMLTSIAEEHDDIEEDDFYDDVMIEG